MLPRMRFFLATLLVWTFTFPAFAYVEAPLSLGAVIAQSSNIMVVTVTAIDKEKNLIIYKKVQDLKGKHPQDTIKHNIGRAGLRPNEWKEIMDLAEVGKTGLFFHNGSASETYLGTNWYQAYPRGEWWDMSHAEPFLLRSFSGKSEKLISAVNEILAGKEVIVSCMVDGNKEDLHFRRARIQRLKASLKLQDYNAKRDFAGWGGEDIRKLSGMPAFGQFAALGKVDAEAQAVSVLDFDGDGKLDICLTGTSRLSLLSNQGDSFSETLLPNLPSGARSSVWADYNLDGKPDLLLATIHGPKLYTNLGSGQFRDDSNLLPKEPCYNLTSAAWIDADADGKPDILLGNGFHGLRLYRNKMTSEMAMKLAPPKFGDWYYIGPFPNPNNQGFDKVYPPEKEIDLKKQYDGKNNEKAVWKKGQFPDGSVHNLALFQPQNNSDSVVYLYREIEVGTPTEIPISLGSDDSLTVWVNGEKILSENVARPCAPDQNKAIMKLRTGKNILLLKIGQGYGDWAFYFSAGQPVISSTSGWFEDASSQWGLGNETVKGDTLAVLDINNDGKADFLYGAEKGMLFLNTGKGFALKADSGLEYQPGKIGPVFSDFNNDGFIDLFVPQLDGKCKLYQNDGTAHFIDVTSKSGDLAKSIAGAVCATWGDFNNDGHLDLFVGCLRDSNRYFQNNGNGTFSDKSVEIGLHQKRFNTQALILADINNDGRLDLILNNEGQDSALLFASPELPMKRFAIQVQFPLQKLSIGSRVRVLKEGKVIQSCMVSGADARGGQSGLVPRFTLEPGNYQIEAMNSQGQVLTKTVTVTDTPMKVMLEEKK